MEVLYLKTQAQKIGCKILAHLLCKGSHQYSLTLIYGLPYFSIQVFHLTFRRLDCNLRVQETCRSYKLLDYLNGFLFFPGAGGGGYIYPLPYLRIEFLIFQRSVIQGGGKTEAIVDQVHLSGPVSFIHGSYLRKSNMAFVNECNKIIREIIQEDGRSLPRLPSCERSGIILNA